MAIVTALTAAAMQAIANATFKSAVVNGSGHLILTKNDNTTLDAGNVKGAAGATGATGSTGAQGPQGNPGNDASAPPGTVVMYTAAVAPSGWHICNGNGISRSANAALFAVIGTTYGNGDGSTTFNVPNMQAKFPRQDTSNLGTVAGASTHDHQIDGGSTVAAAEITFLAGSPNGVMNKVTTANWTATDQIVTTGEGTSSGVRTQGAKVIGQTNTADHTPPYVNFNFIIKQ